MNIFINKSQCKRITSKIKREILEVPERSIQLKEKIETCTEYKLVSTSHSISFTCQ